MENLLQLRQFSNRPLMIAVQEKDWDCSACSRKKTREAEPRVRVSLKEYQGRR